MTAVEVRLAEIFGDAEAHGYLDHKYAEVMYAQVTDLVADLAETTAMLNAELAVARAEVDALEVQRSATRLYLGVALDKADLNDTEPVAALRGEVLRVLRDVGVDRKIQCIKELRGSLVASDAWQRLNNKPTMSLNGTVGMGLKDAKDIIDSAASGFLYCGVAGKFPL